MKQWLAWRMDEFGPVLTGKAERLYEGESPEAFLEALAAADPETLAEYSEPLYEVLIRMASRDDGSSVRRLLALAPGLDPGGYRDGFTALGAAAVQGGLNAMEALWELGAGADLSLGLCDELEFCWQYDVPLEAARWIFRHGAPVDGWEALQLILDSQWELLRLALEEAQPERIACGQGVKALVAYVQDYARENPEDPEITELLEQGLTLLKEFI